MSSSKKQIFHFIGIGGIGLSAIATIMKNIGYNVQGSDQKQSEITKKLQNNGIKVFIGHNKDNIKDANIIIKSSAIKDDNEEIIEAIKNKKQIAPRHKALALIAREKKSIAITGSHGKTTTSAIVSQIFNKDMSSTSLVGGILQNNKNNFTIGTSEWIIIEADDSDNTFIKIPINIGIITNIDYDHIDFHKTKETLNQRFIDFMENTYVDGFCIACFDDEKIKQTTKYITSVNFISYGIKCDEEIDARATNIKYEENSMIFDIIFSEKASKIFQHKKINSINIPLNGVHNVLNSTAAICAGMIAGINVKIIQKALLDFAGVERRFTNIGEYNGAKFISDYAHHPKEIYTTINEAKKTIKKNGKIILVLQPHRYSRFNLFFDDFVNTIKSSTDIAIILETYSAGEKENIKIRNSKELVDELKKFDKEIYYSQDNKVFDILKYTVNKNDIVFFMGAGNIDKIAKKTFTALQKTNNI